MKRYFVPFCSFVRIVVKVLAEADWYIYHTTPTHTLFRFITKISNVPPWAGLLFLGPSSFPLSGASRRGLSVCRGRRSWRWYRWGGRWSHSRRRPKPGRAGTRGQTTCRQRLEKKVFELFARVLLARKWRDHIATRTVLYTCQYDIRNARRCLRRLRRGLCCRGVVWRGMMIQRVVVALRVVHAAANHHWLVEEPTQNIVHWLETKKERRKSVKYSSFPIVRLQSFSANGKESSWLP